MRGVFIYLFLFLLTASAFGQIDFERGYFISNDNQRVECFIKNYDWDNNPKEFVYKLNANDNPIKGDLITTKEFGITGFSKFIRAAVKVDRSPMELSDLSNIKNPIWSQEQLFLKVLIAGKVSLYCYKETNFVRFFYSTSIDTAIQQLIYKEYFVDGDKIDVNAGFRQQLWVNIRCSNTSENSIKSIGYNENDLEKYFKKKNECSGDSIIVYNTKENRNLFTLSATPGLNYSSISISNTLKDNNITDFHNKINLRIGIEAELILPFNMNKWGIVFEPTFQTFNSKKQTTSINYSSIEFPIGIRHYFFLHDNKKIFLNIFTISGFGLNFNSSINVNNSQSFDIKTFSSFALGGGIVNKRISMELRYYTNREILGYYVFWATGYQRFSLILGYKLLKTGQNK
jgi:hypothetical protein